MNVKLDIDINEKQAALLAEFVNAVSHDDIAKIITDKNDALDVVVALERLNKSLPQNKK